MSYTRKFGKWRFEVLWSYGISIGVRGMPSTWDETTGIIVDVPLLILTFWTETRRAA